METATAICGSGRRQQSESVSVPGTVEYFADSLSDPISAVPGTGSDVRDCVSGWEFKIQN